MVVTGLLRVKPKMLQVLTNKTLYKSMVVTGVDSVTGIFPRVREKILMLLMVKYNDLKFSLTRAHACKPVTPVTGRL